MLLKAWGDGDQAALDRLTPLVYAQLHRMARRHMRTEHENTLQTTALVHEAYLRLVDAKGLACQDRTHFFAFSAQIMRRILVDAARARVDARKARVIELRFFGGLSVEETAEVLDISPQSVMRDWKLARAWLVRALGQ